MADVEEPQYATLAERIAALNQQKNFSAPAPKARRAPPPPPPTAAARPTIQSRKEPPLIPGTNANGSLQRSPTVPARPNGRDNPPVLPRRATDTVEGEDDKRSPPLPGRNSLIPPLPSRNSTQQISPVLPPRRPSTQRNSTRRNSNESEISIVSTASALSLNHTSSATSVGSADGQPARFKLPPTLDQAKLPPLPPTRRELEAKAARNALVSSQSSPVVPRAIEPPPRPSLPPRLPSRPARSPVAESAQESVQPVLPARRLPPPPSSYTRPKSALESGFNSQRKTANDTPPPVPLASRPSLAQIELSSRAPPPLPAEASCMICRDFSRPDTTASQYPIASLPRQDPVGYLAHHLCSPFASPTDKARAVFAWCHHNIAYDVDAFFGGCIPRGQSIEEMIFSGKGVCEGYAKIYHAIAIRGGLECYVVCGHGKGFGYGPLKPGERPPPKDATGHAWNAVRIDNGQWKLIDACWGAGNVCDKRAERYEKKFAPFHFTASNEKFGEKHFPEDERHFYRADGRALSWEEYIVEKFTDEPATLYSNAKEEGIEEDTLTPKAKNIPVYSGQVVRFQFGKLCEHWTYEKHGGGKIPYLYMIKINGVDGRKEDYVCMQHDGFWWYVDIPARDLGAPGQQIFCYALRSFKNREGRGVSAAEFRQGWGKVAMGWTGIATWSLV